MREEFERGLGTEKEEQMKTEEGMRIKKGRRWRDTEGTSDGGIPLLGERQECVLRVVLTGVCVCERVCACQGFFLPFFFATVFLGCLLGFVKRSSVLNDSSRSKVK